MNIPEALTVGGGGSAVTIIASKLIDKLPLFKRNGNGNGKCPHPDQVKLIAQDAAAEKVNAANEKVNDLKETMVRIENRIEFLYQSEIKRGGDK